MIFHVPDQIDKYVDAVGADLDKSSSFDKWDVDATCGHDCEEMSYVVGRYQSNR